MVKCKEPFSLSVVHLHQLALHQITLLPVEFHVEQAAHVGRPSGVGAPGVGREPDGVAQLVASVVHVYIHLLLGDGASEGPQTLHQRTETAAGSGKRVGSVGGRFCLSGYLHGGVIARCHAFPHYALLLLGTLYAGLLPERGVVSCAVNGIQQVVLHLHLLSLGGLYLPFPQVVGDGPAFHPRRFKGACHIFHLGEAAAVGIADAYDGLCLVGLCPEVLLCVEYHIGHLSFESHQLVALCFHIECASDESAAVFGLFPCEAYLEEVLSLLCVFLYVCVVIAGCCFIVVIELQSGTRHDSSPPNESAGCARVFAESQWNVNVFPEPRVIDARCEVEEVLQV